MIVVRFKVECRPEKVEEALAAFETVIAPSRKVDGVLGFDIGRDLADPNSILAIEVFEDRAALDRQEAQTVVQEVMGRFEDFLAAEPEATVFHVSSSEPYGA
jgi:quinol monooxygenase YgiN